MSWDDYITTLTGSGQVSMGAICSFDGTLWAKSANFNLTSPEVQGAFGAFTNPDPLRASGVILGGDKYFFIQSDDQQIQAKKGQTGCSIAKAGQCLVIGVYGDKQIGGNCRKAVESMRDYIVANGY